MRILLVHFEDDPEAQPWSTLHWDHIVDLGLGGKGTYERWSQRFGCPITTLGSLRRGFEDFRRIRDLLGVGCGQIVDEHGLDWWEIMSILLHEEMETLILLERFAQSVGHKDEVYVSRAGLHADILRCLLKVPVNILPSRRNLKRRGLGHYLKVSNKLSMPQLVDVFWDKYDAGYQLRGRLMPRRRPSKQPVVLLPTAYVNVSRTGIAYANTFPAEHFLLVATRHSGWVANAPPNVAAAHLSSYASPQPRSGNADRIDKQWQSLRDELINVPEFDILNRLGYLDVFSRRFRHGFEVRDAWRNVLDQEPVQGVLCADDSNPYTRIPLLLAKNRGLANIACHHGALDGRYVFKRTYGDVIWVKGKMEQDYLQRKCGVQGKSLEIAGPELPETLSQHAPTSRESFRQNILFISEVFEAGCGRAEQFYRDILPSLAEMALRNGRNLIVKLHPAESRSERSAMIARVLSSEQKNVTRIATGALDDDLLSSAWFAITILSTAAMECSTRGIPCFLCQWLESWPYGYVEQFIRFGVGIGLSEPADIEKIPEYLRSNIANANVIQDLWEPVRPNRLQELLNASGNINMRAVS